MTCEKNEPRCPMVGGQTFEPGLAAQVADPFPWLRAARRETPVFFMPETGEWCVTRYEDVLHVLHDPVTFSSRYVVNPRQLPGLEQLEDGHPSARALVNTDPPEHTRLRKLVQRGFSPRRLAAFRPAVESIADRLIDELAADGSVDLLTGYAEPLVLEAITTFVGIPASWTDLILRWQDGLIRSLETAPPLDAADAERIAALVLEVDALLRGLLDDRRAEPREDLISLLVHAPSGDPSKELSSTEILRLIANVLGAATVNTAHLICHLVQRLLEEPTRWERVSADRRLVEDAIEETMREAGPVRAVRRDVTRDVTLAGVPIPAGSRLYVSYASAQHDDSIFDEPERWDMDRSELGQQIGVGKGVHFCLGAALARMEVAIAIERLLDRLPDLRLTDRGRPDVVAHHRMHHLVTRLDVEFSPRVAAA